MAEGTVGCFRQDCLDCLWFTDLLGITGFLATREGFGKFFTSIGRHLGPRYGSRYGFNSWIHRRRQLEASILWACVTLVNAGKTLLLTLLTLTAGSLMLYSWRLLLMLCPIREWNRCHSQLGVFCCRAARLISPESGAVACSNAIPCKLFFKRHASGLIRYPFF